MTLLIIRPLMVCTSLLSVCLVKAWSSNVSLRLKISEGKKRELV